MLEKSSSNNGDSADIMRKMHLRHKLERDKLVKKFMKDFVTLIEGQEEEIYQTYAQWCKKPKIFLSIDPPCIDWSVFFLNKSLPHSGNRWSLNDLKQEEQKIIHNDPKIAHDSSTES